MEKAQIQVCPSILSGDFGKLADEAKRIEQAGADAIHIDIMQSAIDQLMAGQEKLL